jgi:hypothetical protein
MISMETQASALQVRSGAHDGKSCETQSSLCGALPNPSPTRVLFLAQHPAIAYGAATGFDSGEPRSMVSTVLGSVCVADPLLLPFESGSE